jgi:hypothetical protein
MKKHLHWMHLGRMGYTRPLALMQMRRLRGTFGKRLMLLQPSCSLKTRREQCRRAPQ